MDDDLRARLAQEPALAKFPASLAAAAQPLRLAGGERLFSIGERPRRMYYVLSGELRLTRASRAGGETILQRTRRGFLAEASLEADAYHCDAVAAAASALLAFPIAELRRLLDADPAFRNAWMTHLAGEVRRLRARCERLSLKGAEARILHYLETEAQDDAGVAIVSRKAWAAELGLTHEALYRALARLTGRGAVAAAGELLRLAVPPH